MKERKKEKFVLLASSQPDNFKDAHPACSPSPPAFMQSLFLAQFLY